MPPNQPDNNAATHAGTLPADVLPRTRKLAYGIGGFAENFFNNALNVMATPFLNIGYGVSPALVSVAMTIPRVWDALTDPVMGAISDRHRGRFGRRRPFIFIGGVLTSLAFAALWWVPQGLGEQGTFWAFLAMLLIYYTVFTLFIVPYIALGYELTGDYNERTRLMGYKSFFSVAAGFAMNWLYWLTQRDAFDGIVDGMRWVGLGCGVLLMVATLVPALTLKEPPLSALPPRAASGKGIGLLESLRAVVTCKPFLLVIASCVSVVVGVLTIMQVGMYLNIYYVCAGDHKLASAVQGITGSSYQIASLITVPIASWLGVRLGKKRALMGLLSLGVVGSLSSWFLLTPAAPYLQIVSLLFTAPAIGSLWILTASMIADICDYDDDLGKGRREGAFGAASGWFTKLGGSVALLASGFVLVATGFDVKLEAGQSHETLTAMRALNALVPAGCFALAVFLIRRYPLDESTMHAIRERIAKRAPNA